MAFVEGDRFRHKLTGQLYQVKVIENDTIVLESEDTPYRMCFIKQIWNYCSRWQRKEQGSDG